MSAACSTFGEVGDLARRHARGFENTNWWLTHGHPVLVGVVRSPVDLCASMAARVVERVARQFADSAVWFRGAREALNERDSLTPMDPDFVLVEQLRRIEADLMSLREQTLSLAKARRDRRARTGALTRAFDRLATSAATFYEEVRAFRGAVQAYEADRSCLDDVAACTTPEEFAEVMERLTDHT